MSPSSDGGHLSTREGTFHTTHWSVVVAARDPNDGTLAREALATICSAYWYPLYAFVRRQGATPAEAEDLTQGFFYHLIEKDSLRKVASAGGRFRSFLLACLKHYLANEREKANAQRRGGGCTILSLDAGSAETQYVLEPKDNETPEVIFERRWACAVLERSLQELESDYRHRGQGELFDALKDFLPGSGGNATRAEVASKYGMSAGVLDVAVHRLRQRFGSVLRRQVAQTVSSPEEVEQEIRYLISAIAA
jgi:DNA-directed RNA polymerase specialized sigma24 family protein